MDAHLMNDEDFINDMRTYKLDHSEDGYPCVQTWQIDRLIDIIDRQAERCAEIAHTTEPPKSIGRQMGRHHSAGAQHAARRIRKEFNL